MTIDTAPLSEAFAEALELQAHQQGRTLTPLNLGTAAAFFAEAIRTIEDDNINTSFKALPAATGAGKSMGAVAFIAAAYKLLPDFTAAYCVEGIRQAEEIRQNLVALMGADAVTCWTSGHCVNRNAVEIEKEYGMLPSVVCDKDAMKTARVIVTTHAQWKAELEKRKPRGVRWYKPKAPNKGLQRRSLIVIDEAPKLVDPIECIPTDITLLRDRIFERDRDHPLIPALDRVVDRMNELWTSEGQHFALADIVSPDDEAAFRRLMSLRAVWAFVHADYNESEKKQEAAKLAQAVSFIAAAARGFAFLHRETPLFIGYSTAFRSGPGHIILDACATLSGMAQNLNAEIIDVPTVDYSRLRSVHIDHPKAFKYVTKVANKPSTAKPYAEWIKSTVVAHTKPGDEVLIVVHKGIIDADPNYIPPAENTNDPWLLEGRRINVIHWGVGIGSNKYGHKSTVFLFGEHFMPRTTTFATTNFYEREKVTPANLRMINSAVLLGRYREIADGHLLSWFRQLAGRGSLRNINEEGVANPMTLIMSGDFDRIIGAWAGLFPNAPAPEVVREKPKTAEEAKGTLKGTDGLVRLLATAKEGELPSDMVAAFTGIRTSDLSRTLKNPKVQATMVAYGWTYESGKLTGNKSRLVRIVGNTQAA